MPTKKLRKRFLKLCFLPKIYHSTNESLPLKKYEKRINVSFCFDSNLVNQAAVTITSLLAASKNKCDYNIYCVISDDVKKKHKDLLNKVIKNTGSILKFVKANNDFDASKRGKWPVAIFYRLMLPKLLPDIDQIIYADCDVVFCNDLIEADRIDMGKNLLAAVIDKVKNQFNSGFLVMNLKQIRKENTYAKWIALSHEKEYRYPDQDILIATCIDRCIDLPLRYNFQPDACYRKSGKRRHSDQDWHDLKYHVVMIHYAGPKPWRGKETVFTEIWWKHAKQTGLF